IIGHRADAAIVIPPRVNAVEPNGDQPPDRKHIAAIIRDGRMKWQASTGYGRRALVETAIGRYKFIIGRRLRGRSSHAQQTEVAIGAILNRILGCARPKSVPASQVA
ncbi:IS5/IS1182 family transposase, partial [Mesorhizobium sp. M0698]